MYGNVLSASVWPQRAILFFLRRPRIYGECVYGFCVYEWPFGALVALYIYHMDGMCEKTAPNFAYKAC